MSLSSFTPATVPVTLTDGTVVDARRPSRADVIAAITGSPVWPQAAALIGDKTSLEDWSSQDQIQAVLLVLAGFPDVLARIVAAVSGEPYDVVAGLPLGVPIRILEAALTA